jgi:hypothetical protein
MEGRETPIMQKYGESKTTRIMMATVRHVTSEAGRTKIQAAGFLLNRVYIRWGQYGHVCYKSERYVESIRTCFVQGVTLYGVNRVLTDTTLYIIWGQ